MNVPIIDAVPQPIRNAIVGGQAILFLGAGASVGAMINGSPASISSDDLRNALSDAFLGSRYKDRSLRFVAQLARNEASVRQVQEKIRDIFLPLGPAPFHKLIPTFSWFAIVTTNYDLVIEEAYRQTSHRAQELVRITSDQTRMEDVLSSQRTVPYLKLHGCISTAEDVGTPLVIAPEEYASFAKNRKLLVRHFQDWAMIHPILFCGYSLQDENVAQILFDLGDSALSRPQYLYVSPHLDDIQGRYWQSRRIAPINTDLEGFLTALDADVPSNQRTLGVLIDRSALSISKWFVTHSEPSDGLVQYLATELTHVRPDMPTAAPDALAFYSGLDDSWSPLLAGLDVPRKTLEDILDIGVIKTSQSTKPKFFLLKGYAGSGKSVGLKRLALDATKLLDAPLVFHLQQGTVLRPDLLLEICRLTNSRIFVFIDDVLEYGVGFERAMDRLMDGTNPITIIGCARTNEWGADAGRYVGWVSEEFELSELTSLEIDLLLANLERSGALGPLAKYTAAERKAFMLRFSEKQLLVALHEITLGKSFEEIIRDEFERITPRAAQQLYLDICTLHQFRVSARAGFIARISGIGFETLAQYLRTSLSRVIRAYDDHRTRDVMYRSRHDEIAKIVFASCIRSPQERLAQVQRIIKDLDIGYSGDREVFNELTRGRRIAEAFASKELAERIFAAAAEAGPPGSYLLHQRAIFEIYHPAGHLKKALEFIRAAELEALKEIGTNRSTIIHTKANIFRRFANISTIKVERDQYRADARAILKPQLSSHVGTHPEHLYGLILFDEIKEILDPDALVLSADDDTRANSEALLRIVAELNQVLDRALQVDPDNEHMITLRTQLFQQLGQQPRAIDLLRTYVRAHTDQPFPARALAEATYRAGDANAAIGTLQSLLRVAPNDRGACFQLSRYLIDRNRSADADEIGRLLRRSFSEGDSNYDARFWFARHCMLNGDPERGLREFQALKAVALPSAVKSRVRGIVRKEEGPSRFLGSISARFVMFAFVSSPQLPFNAFVHSDSVREKDWSTLLRGSPVSFILGFTFRGPIAQDVRLERL